MIVELRIDDTGLIWTSEDDLVVSDDDMWIGEEGALPGGSFPQERDVTFKIMSSDRYLYRVLHAKATLTISYLGRSHLICSGIITDVSVSPEGDISARILPKASAQILNPDPQRVIDLESFPREGRTYFANPLLASIGDAALGKFAPLVFGRPGATTFNILKGYNFDDSVPGSPAYLVESTGALAVQDQMWLIAGHPVLSPRCVIFNASRSEGDEAARLLADRIVCNVAQYEDDKGFVFAGATINNTYSSIVVGTLEDFMSKGDTFWVKWIDETGEPAIGGMANPYGNGVLTSAGDILRYCAEVSGISWKMDKTHFVEAFRNLKLDTYINEPTELWTWAMQNILPIIPAISVMTAEGVYVAPFNRTLRREDVVLEIGEEGSYGETTFTKGEDLPTAVTLLYASAENVENGFAKSLSIDETVSLTLAKNKTISGSKPALFEASVIYEDSTAADVVAWLTEYYGSTWAYTSVKLLHPDREVSVGLTVWLEAFERVAIIYGWKVYVDGSLELELIFKA